MSIPTIVVNRRPLSRQSRKIDIQWLRGISVCTQELSTQLA